MNIALSLAPHINDCWISIELYRCFAKSGDTYSWLALACLPLSWQALGYAVRKETR